MKHLIFITVCVLTFACSSSNTGKNTNLEGIKWVLYELDGEKFTVPADGKTVFITFDEAEKRASGTAPCNTFFASYTAVKTADGGENVQLSLKLGPVGSTKMSCDNMDTETKYKAALEKTALYKISGSKLYLYDDADKVILRYKAQ